jgi:proteic killer suppression protein
VFMEIESIAHKALRRFVETGSPRGLDGQLVDRLGKMLVFLVSAGSVEQLKAPPNYGAHELSGDRTGTWALTVTRNWRMTFRLDDGGSIIELDLEDYH